jgi:hypothetical protein
VESAESPKMVSKKHVYQELKKLFKSDTTEPLYDEQTGAIFPDGVKRKTRHVILLARFGSGRLLNRIPTGRKQSGRQKSKSAFLLTE